MSTDSEMGSNERIWVQFARSDNNSPVGIIVDLTSPPKYNIGSCTDSNFSLTKLGTGDNRIWTIEKVGTRMKLSCNGVQIFDFETSISKKENCGKLWLILPR